MEPSCFMRFLPLLLLCPAGAPFRICAFNTQRFAQGKASKANVMDTLVKILSRCDIAVLQEVMDAKGKAVPALVAALNRYHSSSPYTYLTSPLLGRNNYQERYVFIYRVKYIVSVSTKAVLQNKKRKIKKRKFSDIFHNPLDFPTSPAPCILYIKKIKLQQINTLFHVFLYFHLIIFWV